MRSRLLRIALTVLLLIPALGGSSLAYICEMDGQIRRECCCDHGAAKKSDCHKVEKRGCCDVRSTGSDPLTQSTRTVTTQHSPAAVTLTATIADIASLATCRSTGPSPDCIANGPPIFLRHCSFLR